MKKIYCTLDKYCRFANRLFIIGYYLCNFYNKNDIIYLNEYDENIDQILTFNNINHEYIEKTEIFPEFNYFQNYKLFNFNKLRKYFKCPNYIKDNIFTKYQNIQNSIVIHIRRGDYLDSNEWLVLTQDNYKKLINKYNLSNETFIIISDDIEWCYNNLNFIKNVNFSNNDLLFDFYCLTLSKFNICSTSSFSLIGSYLNKNLNDHIIPYPYNFGQLNNELIVPKTYKRYNINILN